MNKLNFLLKLIMIIKERSIKTHYKKTVLIVSERLIGASPTIVCSTLLNINPTIAIPIASSSALITSIATLITNEYVSKLKTRCTKLRHWIKLISLLYEKTIRQ